MPKSNANLALKGLDEMFSTEESRQEQKREQVQQIPIEELFPCLLYTSQKGLDFFNALSVGSCNHFRHFNNPMPLHFAVHIFIIQLFQIIREPVIIDRKQTEERGLSSSLTAHKTEHNLKFAPRLKSS